MTGDYATAVAAPVVRMARLVEIALDAETLRVWEGIGTLVALGESWLGTGVFGTVGEIDQSIDIGASGTTLTLSAIPPEMISLALQEDTSGRPCTIYLALFNDNWVLIADPVPVFGGRLDVPTLQDGAESATLVITVENELIALDRLPDPLFYTAADQQRLYPGDRGAEFMAGLVKKTILWGKKKFEPPVAPGAVPTTPAGGGGLADPIMDAPSFDTPSGPDGGGGGDNGTGGFGDFTV